MNNVQLRISSVYSLYHPTEHIGGARLLQHQVETLDAFGDPEIDVIINTAMTGDGKSLAGYLPAFQTQQSIVAMYPTNELIRDQHFALPSYQHNLNIRLPRYDTMYSEKITQLMREHDTTIRMEEVRKLLQRNGILLTNPDLVHLIMSYQYGWGHMHKELPVTTAAFFDYFMFDEFHVFDIPQIISVVNMLGYLSVYYQDKPAQRKKFIFLSATPSPLLTRLLARSGLKVKEIQGKYQSTADDDNYRRILLPCDIEIHEVSQEAPIEYRVEERLEEILAFFQQNPGSKAAILVYSPATARRLVKLLKDYFEPRGITVGENTGLTSLEERRDSLKKHILVGTSTVDIGIDFHINYLIFEAFSAGSFLQRFGRLGRHNEFSVYRAYALVPRFVQERLATTFATEREVERERFNEAIREAFPREQEFASYTKRWGVIQAAHVPEVLRRQQKLDANQAFTEALVAQYEKIYGTPEKPVMHRASKKYWKLHHTAPAILSELLSFRGQNPLECGVWDTTDDHFQTYDLLFLLANTEFQMMPEDVFMQEVRARNFRVSSEIAMEEREFTGRKFYLQIINYVSERPSLVLGLKLNLIERRDLIDQVIVLNTFFVREPSHLRLQDQVNKRLKELPLVCILSTIPRQELKQTLRLGSIFPVYRLQDSTGQEYSVAFGQQALLLDSLLALRKPKDNRAIMA